MTTEARGFGSKIEYPAYLSYTSVSKPKSDRSTKCSSNDTAGTRLSVTPSSRDSFQLLTANINNIADSFDNATTPISANPIKSDQMTPHQATEPSSLYTNNSDRSVSVNEDRPPVFPSGGDNPSKYQSPKAEHAESVPPRRSSRLRPLSMTSFTSLHIDEGLVNDWGDVLDSIPRISQMTESPTQPSAEMFEAAGSVSENKYESSGNKNNSSDYYNSSQVTGDSHVALSSHSSSPPKGSLVENEQHLLSAPDEENGDRSLPGTTPGDPQSDFNSIATEKSNSDKIIARSVEEGYMREPVLLSRPWTGSVNDEYTAPQQNKNTGSEKSRNSHVATDASKQNTAAAAQPPHSNIPTLSIDTKLKSKRPGFSNQDEDSNKPELIDVLNTIYTLHSATSPVTGGNSSFGRMLSSAISSVANSSEAPTSPITNARMKLWNMLTGYNKQKDDALKSLKPTPRINGEKSPKLSSDISGRADGSSTGISIPKSESNTISSALLIRRLTVSVGRPISSESISRSKKLHRSPSLSDIPYIKPPMPVSSKTPGQIVASQTSLNKELLSKGETLADRCSAQASSRSSKHKRWISADLYRIDFSKPGSAVASPKEPRKSVLRLSVNSVPWSQESHQSLSSMKAVKSSVTSMSPKATRATHGSSQYTSQAGRVSLVSQATTSNPASQEDKQKHLNKAYERLFSPNNDDAKLPTSSLSITSLESPKKVSFGPMVFSPFETKESDEGSPAEKQREESRLLTTYSLDVRDSPVSSNPDENTKDSRAQDRAYAKSFESHKSGAVLEDIIEEDPRKTWDETSDEDSVSSGSAEESNYIPGAENSLLTTNTEKPLSPKQRKKAKTRSEMFFGSDDESEEHDDYDDGFDDLPYIGVKKSTRRKSGDDKYAGYESDDSYTSPNVNAAEANTAIFDYIRKRTESVRAKLEAERWLAKQKSSGGGNKKSILLSGAHIPTDMVDSLCASFSFDTSELKLTRFDMTTPDVLKTKSPNNIVGMLDEYGDIYDPPSSIYESECAAPCSPLLIPSRTLATLNRFASRSRENVSSANQSVESFGSQLGKSFRGLFHRVESKLGPKSSHTDSGAKSKMQKSSPFNVLSQSQKGPNPQSLPPPQPQPQSSRVHSIASNTNDGESILSLTNIESAIGSFDISSDLESSMARAGRSSFRSNSCSNPHTNHGATLSNPSISIRGQKYHASLDEGHRDYVPNDVRSETGSFIKLGPSKLRPSTAGRISEARSWVRFVKKVDSEPPNAEGGMSYRGSLDKARKFIKPLVPSGLASVSFADRNSMGGNNTQRAKTVLLSTTSRASASNEGRPTTNASTIKNWKPKRLFATIANRAKRAGSTLDVVIQEDAPELQKKSSMQILRVRKEPSPNDIEDANLFNSSNPSLASDDKSVSKVLYSAPLQTSYATVSAGSVVTSGIRTPPPTADNITKSIMSHRNILPLFTPLPEPSAQHSGPGSGEVTPVITASRLDTPLGTPQGQLRRRNAVHGKQSRGGIRRRGTRENSEGSCSLHRSQSGRGANLDQAQGQILQRPYTTYDGMISHSNATSLPSPNATAEPPLSVGVSIGGSSGPLLTPEPVLSPNNYTQSLDMLYPSSYTGPLPQTSPTVKSQSMRSSLKAGAPASNMMSGNTINNTLVPQIATEISNIDTSRTSSIIIGSEQNATSSPVLSIANNAYIPSVSSARSSSIVSRKKYDDGNQDISTTTDIILDKFSLSPKPSVSFTAVNGPEQLRERVVSSGESIDVAAIAVSSASINNHEQSLQTSNKSETMPSASKIQSSDYDYVQTSKVATATDVPSCSKKSNPTYKDSSNMSIHDEGKDQTSEKELPQKGSREAESAAVVTKETSDVVGISSSSYDDEYSFSLNPDSVVFWYEFDN
ncbi:hypothetical protein H4219_002902 [Mycoemilia scoparia]|uniref:Uncharacterized protein n=1 Tax=Mycoemilia scoparia TaxID=417184 RepID=A0A9W7ZWD6_9FUNG|nr:hypothetical protein H4219_002902 [Mycoemilia scoparia]